MGKSRHTESLVLYNLNLLSKSTVSTGSFVRGIKVHRVAGSEDCGVRSGAGGQPNPRAASC